MSEDDNSRASRARRANPFLNSQQAAFYLGFSIRHLERLRSRGEGPPCRRHQRSFRYHVDELIAWSESRRDALVHA